jgi:hypothetical protein
MENKHGRILARNCKGKETLAAVRDGLLVCVPELEK